MDNTEDADTLPLPITRESAMGEVSGLLFQFLLTLFGGAIGAFVANKLSLESFYRQKWWEARLTAYTNIVESLHDIKFDLSANIETLSQGEETNDKYFEDLAKRNRDAWAKLDRVYDTGEFLLSDDATVQIKTLYQNHDSAGSYDPKASARERLDLQQKQLKAVSDCLESIRRTAKQDLSL